MSIKKAPSRYSEQIQGMMIFSFFSRNLASNTAESCVSAIKETLAYVERGGFKKPTIRGWRFMIEEHLTTREMQRLKTNLKENRAEFDDEIAGIIIRVR